MTLKETLEVTQYYRGLSVSSEGEYGEATTILVTIVRINFDLLQYMDI